MSKIDYELKKIKGFVFDVDGVLSPVTIPLGENGQPMRMVNVKDGLALKTAISLGYRIAIVSGGVSEALRLRFANLNINDVYLGVSDKLPILNAWMQTNGLLPEEVVFVGDDIPDVSCMTNVGLPVAPKDASQEAKNAARYISDIMGGYGVGREIIEEVLRAQNRWVKETKAFGW